MTVVTDELARKAALIDDDDYDLLDEGTPQTTGPPGHVEQGESPTGDTSDVESPPDGPTTESTPAESNGQAGAPESEADAASTGPADGTPEGEADAELPELIQVDGTDYTHDELTQAVAALKDKRDWQAEQTRLSQSLARQVKALEGADELVGWLRNNKEVAQLIKDTLEEESGNTTLTRQFDAWLGYNPQKIADARAQEADTEHRKIADLEDRLFVYGDRWQFAEAHGLTPEQVKRYEAYADELSSDEVAVTLAEAKFKLDLQDEKKALARKELALKAPQVPDQPDKAGGRPTESVNPKGKPDEAYNFFLD